MMMNTTMRNLARASALVAMLLGVSMASGCYSSSDQCGDFQVYDTDRDVCTCDDQAILSNGACTLCNTDEVVVDNECACPEGQVHNGEQACVEVPLGIGTPCNDTDMVCQDPNFPVCVEDGEKRYCSKENCLENDDCGGNFTCALWLDTPICMAAPTGLGDSCSAPAECEELEANICFPLTNECVTELCDVALNDCATGYYCCDVSALDPSVTTLCIPEALIGSCPANQ